MVGGLTFSTNIDPNPAKESMVDQMIGETTSSATAMPITCFVVSIISPFAIVSKFVFWSAYEKSLWCVQMVLGCEIRITHSSFNNF